MLDPDGNADTAAATLSARTTGLSGAAHLGGGAGVPGHIDTAFRVSGDDDTAAGSATQAPESSTGRRVLALASDLVQLTKPRITLMVLLTALGGMALAARSAAFALEWRSALVALTGIAVVVGGANTLNMYLERVSDGLMARTRDRPLPARRLSPVVALGFGIALSVSALVLLAAFTNALTTALAAAALGLYVLVYTPLKRHSDWALHVGAIPGAMPPLLGWTAVTGSIGAPGLGLFGVLFFWQLPHFIAIATLRRDDYVRAGIRVLPAVRGERQAHIHAVAYLVPLIAVSLALAPLGLAGPAYGCVAALLGGGSLWAAVWGFGAASPRRWARSLFLASLVYLPLLMAAVMLGW